MNKESDDILNKKLGELPTYEPESGLWHKVEASLQFSEALSQLPVYQPSDVVWKGIEKELGLKTNTRRNMALAGMAAAVAFLVFMVNRSSTNSRVEIEVVVEQLELPETKGPHSDEFEKILALCSVKKEICEQPAFKEIKHEYEHLQNAGEELRNAMGAFSTEPYLLQELEKIEEQKLQLLHELNRMI